MNSDIQELRSGMIETENKLVEDIEELRVLLNSERVVSLIMAFAREEISRRLRAFDREKLQAMAYRVKKEIKTRPYMTGSIALAFAGLALYGFMPENRSNMLDSVKERLGMGQTGLTEPEIIPRGPAKFVGGQTGSPPGQTGIES